MWLLYETKKYAKTSGMSDGKMVMDKYLIIAKMVAIAEKNNTEAMQSAGMDPTAIMTMADQVRPQLFKIQEQILDNLTSENIISIID
jgi:hypothetical protein